MEASDHDGHGRNRFVVVDCVSPKGPKEGTIDRADERQTLLFVGDQFRRLAGGDDQIRTALSSHSFFSKRCPENLTTPWMSRLAS